MNTPHFKKLRQISIRIVDHPIVYASLVEEYYSNKINKIKISLKNC